MVRWGKYFLTGLVAIASLAYTGFVFSQTTDESLRKILREDVGFGDGDFSALDKGDLVVKLLPTDEKKEIAVCGIVRLRRQGEISIEEFRNSLTPKANKSMLAGATFGSPPVLDDLRFLDLDAKDIASMKQCTVGDCDLKLSAEMIKRLQTEIDWNAADYQAQATQWFRTMILAYVEGYKTRGDNALIQYYDKKKPVSVSAEQQILLDKSLFINEMSPEFAKYLGAYPRFALSGVEDSIEWSKITFGMKPTVTLTHTSAFARQDHGLSQYLVATKQLYASHYIDSSMALSMLVNVPSDQTSSTYLVFTDISRSDSLEGAFGGLKRGMVGNRGVEHVKDLLALARFRLDGTGPNASEMGTGDADILQYLGDLTSTALFRVALILIVAASILAYRRWRFA